MYITKEQMESHVGNVIKDALGNLIGNQIKDFIADLPSKLPDLLKGLLNNHPEIQELKRQQADSLTTIAELKAKVESLTAGKTVPIADSEESAPAAKPNTHKKR